MIEFNIWIEVIATERELDEYSYKPLKSGSVYRARFTTDSISYFDILVEDINKHTIVSGVWKERIKVISISELRERRLNYLGI